MKKRIFLAVVIVVIATAAAGWNYSQSNNKIEMSELALDNINALAAGEHGPDWGKHKLVTISGKQCCTEDPYLDCNGAFSPCN